MHETKLRGARTHNLKSVSLSLSAPSLIGIAGPSGSGKSSLAFATLYAEGQRRYVESFSAYARQFLERLPRPPVDSLYPVPAGIAVDRQNPVKTSRSTVGTMTEVNDYVKALWARAAELRCPGCGEPVTRDEAGSATKRVLQDLKGEKILVSYPVSVRDQEHFLGVREQLLADGFRRIITDGQVKDLDEVRPSAITTKKKAAKKAAAKKKGPSRKGRRGLRKKPELTNPLAGVDLHVLADRTVARASDQSRIHEALESAFSRGAGRASVRTAENQVLQFSSGLHCTTCDRSFSDKTPGMFSFNSPVGACEPCKGFGRVIAVDFDQVIPDRSLTLKNGAIKAFSGKRAGWERKHLAKFAKAAGVPMDLPVSEFTEAQWNWLVEGDGNGYPNGWFGIKEWFRWMQSRAYKMHVRVFLARYRKYVPCETCEGTRLKPAGRAWHVQGTTLPEFLEMPAAAALDFLNSLPTTVREDPGTRTLLTETETRLQTLCDVGLSYLSLSRPSRTLSGGETQRVALTSALGASLTGAMFVLDEPTVGLHPADVERLFHVVRRLTDGDNLAIIVEHDLEVLSRVDRVIELGPGAGDEGGNVVFDGTPKDLRTKKTKTGNAMRADALVSRKARTPVDWIVLKGCTGNNLKGIDVRVPIGVLTCVTGVSGSGKSSLLLDTLVPAATEQLGSVIQTTLPHKSLSLTDHISRVVFVDQSPLGRTSRGNTASYVEAWDVIRKRFASTPLAKERGYTTGTFSFNSPNGGRCESCGGQGSETIEMQFLADVSFSCADCGGKRFVGPVLDIALSGADGAGNLNVADVLQLTVEQAAKFFAGDALVLKRLAPLVDLGLGYMSLGQPLNTLSGGEAQRLKLAKSLTSLGQKSEEKTLLVLDEPTAGLHASDVDPLLDTLQRLVDVGHTVVVVEHDMRVAASSDWVIDLGPGAGGEGGTIVAEGPPKKVSTRKNSTTAKFLAIALGEKKSVPKKNEPPKANPKMRDVISLKGAREHNLKNVSVDVPREKLVVVTGPSGSGKSSLAFDVLYAEGQRRYLQTLSPYARQYLPQLPRPELDQLIGIPPSVSLEQRMTRGGANSTVATMTEVAHYLRLLYARAGTLFCPDCQVPIQPRPAPVLAKDLASEMTRLKEKHATLLAPVVRGRKGNHRVLLEQLRNRGIEQARIDGLLTELTDGLSLGRYLEHDIDAVIGTSTKKELEEPLRLALKLGEGTASVILGGEELLLSSKRACPSCLRGYPELDPRFFSFNTRQGACGTCEGRGEVVTTVGRGRNAKETFTACEDCAGKRLSHLARSVMLGGQSIDVRLSESVASASKSIADIKLTGRQKTIGEAALRELSKRLSFLDQVGLGYLGLDRPAYTLSGGEMQRVRLSAQLGSGLTGVLYVLDEPTIGLHPRDTGRLLKALRELVERGNSVLVVEHDADTIRAADHLIDVGPGGGRTGGTIVAEGTPAKLLADPKSVTGRALSRPLAVPKKRRPLKQADWIELKGAEHHNLKKVDLKIPAGRLTAVTGVSGSGKSTLVREVFLRAVRKELGLVADKPGTYRSIKGVSAIKRAIEVDQSPIGRTPRSVPATYVGIWDHLRKHFAGTQDARARGYGPSRFSFNVKEGRCPECEGQGQLRLEMSFLPQVHVPCEACGGRRFNRETEMVKLHNKSPGEVLELEIEEALDVFSSVPKVAHPLRLLTALGLGYLKLGQPSNTLSGGEAQRLKLVSELTAGGGPTLYVMDEPTTGLHRDDVSRLLTVIEQFVERGDTVVVIEHQPDVIIAADYVVDLGPEGGEGGGTVVVEGTPEKLVKSKKSHTGAVLRAELGTAPTIKARAQAPR